MSDEERRSFQVEYWEEVKRIAQDAIDGLKSGEIERIDVSDSFHESIDSHTYVIHTGLARQVLAVSQHSDAIFDENGPQTWANWEDAHTQGAYYAMRADVQAEFEELDEETDEDEEE